MIDDKSAGVFEVVPWAFARTDADPTLVVVYAQTGALDAAPVAAVIEHEETVLIELSRPVADGAFESTTRQEMVPVRLGSPLGDRALIDAATKERHHPYDGQGMVSLAGLPPTYNISVEMLLGRPFWQDSDFTDTHPPASWETVWIGGSLNDHALLLT